MARPRAKNLASPIFNHAPPLNADCNHFKIGKIMGGFPNPPAMESTILATLKHQKCPL
jgi:hypothetical protein